jgi:hypothetical protein
MMRWMKNSKKGMAMLAAVAFMLVACWQFGVSGTEAPFSEKEVALVNGVEGSGGPNCRIGPRCNSGTYYKCYVGGTGNGCICITC